MEKKRKKRSHEEVVAAREAYAKERHEKQLVKEAKKAEREKLLAEREERRKLREARKSMTPTELRNSRMEQRVKKARGKNQDISVNDVSSRLHAYGGEIRPGDLVKAYFAGCPVIGEIIEINYAEEDEDSRLRFDIYTILVKDKGPYSGMTCYVRREKIINKFN